MTFLHLKHDEFPNCFTSIHVIWFRYYNVIIKYIISVELFKQFLHTNSYKYIQQ